MIEKKNAEMAANLAALEAKKGKDSKKGKKKWNYFRYNINKVIYKHIY